MHDASVGEEAGHPFEDRPHKSKCSPYPLPCESYRFFHACLRDFTPPSIAGSRGIIDSSLCVLRSIRRAKISCCQFFTPQSGKASIRPGKVSLEIAASRTCAPKRNTTLKSAERCVSALFRYDDAPE